MKKLVYILLILHSTSNFLLAQGNLNNTGNGTINNLGKIIVKNGKLTSTGANSISNSGGQIKVIQGQAEIRQDTIKGQVQFQSDKSYAQLIPQIVYDSVQFSGQGEKQLEKSKNLVSLGQFRTDTNSNITWNKDSSIQIHSKGNTVLNGYINFAYGFGKLAMNGNKSQIIEGIGIVPNLQLDNSFGADVVDNTGKNPNGFKVSNRLELYNGFLRNSETANFTMGDKSTISRSIQGGISTSPVFENRVNVEYVGTELDSTILASGEIPDVKKYPLALDTLTVANVNGIQLSSDVQVNGQILMNSNIKNFTEKNSKVDKNYELYSSSANGPQFGIGTAANKDAEIQGKFTRKIYNKSNFKDTLLFNNRLTGMKLDAVTNINKFTMDMKPNRIWEEDIKGGIAKIKRPLVVSALDDNDLDVKDASVRVFFAWKSSKVLGNYNETPDKAFKREKIMVLQTWDPINKSWEDIDSTRFSKPVIEDSTKDNYWVKTDGSFLKLGEIAAGFSSVGILQFYIKIAMEGAWRVDSSNDNINMTTELVNYNLVPETPPQIYPYILDPNSKNLVVSIDSMKKYGIVDWVTVEFRKSLNTDSVDPSNGRFFRTALLRKDGTIVDTNCHENVFFSQSTTQNMDTTGRTPYYLSVRHRNHLTLTTARPRSFNQNANGGTVDLTLADGTSGDYITNDSIPKNDYKLVGRRYVSRTPIYGMVGGNFILPSLAIDRDALLKGVDGIDVIENTKTDPLQFEDYGRLDNYLMDPNIENEYLTYRDEGFRLSGMVTTRDFNISWNNRGDTKNNPKPYKSWIK